MYKQIIIARKDLGMSPGKLAAQVSHASMSFLAWMVRNNTKKLGIYDHESHTYSNYRYYTQLNVDIDLFENWLDGSFTKVVLQARNKNHLMKAVEMAKELGMVEGKDFFLIRDACRTELEPEEDGSTLTCIGFKPMSDEVIDLIGKKYHMYEG